MNTRENLIAVFREYLDDYGENYNAETFVDFVVVALTDAGEIKHLKPHDAISLIRWFRAHADRLEWSMPLSEASSKLSQHVDRMLATLTPKEREILRKRFNR